MTKEKTWPTSNDLFGYFMYEKYDCTPSDEITPQWFSEKLEEFRSTSPFKLHKEFYRDFYSFQEKFLEPSKETNE